MKKYISSYLVLLLIAGCSQQPSSERTLSRLKMVSTFDVALDSKSQLELESDFDKVLNPQNLDNWMKHMSSKPHYVGSPWSKQNAEYVANKFEGRLLNRCTVMAVPARGDKFGRLVEDPTMDRLCDGLGPNNWQSHDITKTPFIRPVRSYVHKVGVVLKRRFERNLYVEICGWWCDVKKAFYNWLMDAGSTIHMGFSFENEEGSVDHYEPTCAHFGFRISPAMRLL